MTARELGERLHPASVTDAWYAQGCPPRLDASGISRRDRLAWAVSRQLRRARAES